MIVLRQPEEVARWHVAFHMKQGQWRFEPLIPGRFSHVSAFAWLPKARAWLLMDFSPRTGPHCVVWPFLEDDKELPLGLAQWIANASILTADVRRKQDWTPKLGLFCVSQVKQLLGFRSWALSPEGLWRDLVRQGARVVFHANGLDVSAAAPARPDAGGPDQGRPKAAGTGDPAVP